MEREGRAEGDGGRVPLGSATAGPAVGGGARAAEGRPGVPVGLGADRRRSGCAAGAPERRDDPDRPQRAHAARSSDATTSTGVEPPGDLLLEPLEPPGRHADHVHAPGRRGRRRPRSARRATTSSTCGGGRRSPRSSTARSRSIARAARRVRSTRRASSSSEGWSIVVFPEGTRSADGHLQRFRHGAARLALETGAGLAPIAIVGAFQAMPKGRFWPRAGRPPVTVRYGEPFWPQEGRDASGPVAADDPGRDAAVPRGAHDLVGGAASRAARRDPVARRPVRARTGSGGGRARARSVATGPAKVWE